MAYKKISEEETKNILDYLKAGYSVNKTAMLTNHDWGTVDRIRKIYCDSQATNDNVVEMPTKDVEETPEPVKDTVRDHRDDPRFASSIKIEMVAKIEGNKTGYGYRADFGKKVLTITTAEGTQLELEFSVIEKFLDEMIDISVEVGDLKKKFA